MCFLVSLIRQSCGSLFYHCPPPLPQESTKKSPLEDGIVGYPSTKDNAVTKEVPCAKLDFAQQVDLSTGCRACCSSGCCCRCCGCSCDFTHTPLCPQKLNVKFPSAKVGEEPTSWAKQAPKAPFHFYRPVSLNKLAGYSASKYVRNLPGKPHHSSCSHDNPTQTSSSVRTPRTNSTHCQSNPITSVISTVTTATTSTTSLTNSSATQTEVQPNPPIPSISSSTDGIENPAEGQSRVNKENVQATTTPPTISWTKKGSVATPAEIPIEQRYNPQYYRGLPAELTKAIPPAGKQSGSVRHRTTVKDLISIFD